MMLTCFNLLNFCGNARPNEVDFTVIFHVFSDLLGHLLIETS